MIVRVIRRVLLVFTLAALVDISPLSAAAILSLTPTSLTLQANTGSNVPNQLVQVSKTGNGVLNWSVVSPTATWVTVTPTSGKDAGTLTLTFKTSALAAGTYQTSFNVKSNSGSIVTVTVKVTMVAPSSPPPPTTSTTIYVSTTGVDTNPGTQSSPLRTIQRAVQFANAANAAGRAMSIVIAAGTYRENVDLNGQSTDAALTIQGAGASTIVSGADVWSTGWTPKADGSLVHPWPYVWGMKPVPASWGNYWNWDGNGYKRDVLRRSEMVYVNGSALRGVLSLSALTAGTFFVDESLAQLYMRLPAGVTLSTATIEVGMRVMPFRINARRNVTIRNLAVMRSRGGLQDTAFSVTNSRNLTFDGLTVRWMAYGGFGGSYNTTIRIYRSVFSDNGVASLAEFRDVDVLVEDSEIARNNWRGWPAIHTGWDVNFKWSGIRDGVVRHSRFVSNQAHGFWIDTDNKRITLENSLMASNNRYGIWMENNQGPVTIQGNRICNNYDGGLADGRSDRVTLKSNQIWGTARYNIFFTGTYAGKTMTDWQTGQSITNHSLYWTVDSNIVSGSGAEGFLWLHSDYAAPGAWAMIRDSLVFMDNNIWYHSSRTNPFWLPQGQIGYAAFKADITSANTSFELHSKWQVPPTLSCTLP